LRAREPEGLKPASRLERERSSPERFSFYVVAEPAECSFHSVLQAASPRQTLQAASIELFDPAVTAQEVQSYRMQAEMRPDAKVCAGARSQAAMPSRRRGCRRKKVGPESYTNF